MNRRLPRLLAATALSALAIAAPAAAAVPEYFTVPQGRGAAPGIAAAPDGTVWFGATQVGQETRGRRRSAG